MVLLPIHIVFLELIIDLACSVVFEAEAEEAEIMQRKPIDPKERLFGKRTLAISVVQGIVALTVVPWFIRLPSTWVKPRMSPGLLPLSP